VIRGFVLSLIHPPNGKARVERPARERLVLTKPVYQNLAEPCADRPGAAH